MRRRRTLVTRNLTLGDVVALGPTPELLADYGLDWVDFIRARRAVRRGQSELTLWRHMKSEGRVA